MEITYDPVKNARNIAERGLSFERAAEVDFETALFLVDERHEYGEFARSLSDTWMGVCMCSAL